MSDATQAGAAERNAIGRWWERSSKLDPRYLIAFLITLVLVAAQLRYHIVGGYERLALALLACTATEALLSWFDRGKVVNLQSAYISGISLTLGQPVLPELAPITGPMYQLFVFFMITDPRTVVRGRRGQIVVAVIVAVAETLIRFASDNGWPLPTAFNVAPAFL